jgi:hypothetical protein
MDLSLASIIAAFFVAVVAFILRRQMVLRRRMDALRGEMASVQRNRLALEIAVSDKRAGQAVQPKSDDGEGR